MGPVQQLLGWMQFTMRTPMSSCFLKKASSSGSGGLWQVLMTVSFGLASHPGPFILYWPVNHFSAELHTFGLFLCIERIPVTFSVCPSCGACNHPSHYSSHVSCSTVCLLLPSEFVVLQLCIGFEVFQTVSFIRCNLFFDPSSCINSCPRL